MSLFSGLYITNMLMLWTERRLRCLGCGIHASLVRRCAATCALRYSHRMLDVEMVEPLEETRSELIFATEPVLSSLYLSIPGSFQYTPLVELDEIEVCCLLRSTLPRY